MEITGKILAKKTDNKALKLNDENWYNMNSEVVPYLEKISKGDSVTLTYENKKGVRYVSKLVKGGTSAPKEEKEEPELKEGQVICPGCGKPKKEDKYEYCFMCNKAGKGKKKEESSIQERKTYDNPEKTAQIQRGNALNAAASVASSQQFTDPDQAAQFTLELAERFLDYLRAE